MTEHSTVVTEKFATPEHRAMDLSAETWQFESWSGFPDSQFNDGNDLWTLHDEQ